MNVGIEDIFVLKNAFSNFTYKDPYNLEPFNQVHETKEEAQCSGIGTRVGGGDNT
jgi:hypothetical protein